MSYMFFENPILKCATLHDVVSSKHKELVPVVNHESMCMLKHHIHDYRNKYFRMFHIVVFCVGFQVHFKNVINVLILVWFSVNVPSVGQLYQIARNIGLKWKLLGHQLGVTSAKMEHIEMDNDKAVYRIGNMLESWREQNYSEATFDNLFAAMQSKRWYEPAMMSKKEAKPESSTNYWCAKARLPINRTRGTPVQYTRR